MPYNIININELDSPALVVFPDLVKRNIKTALEMVGEVSRFRPHIKTHKTIEVIQLCQELGIQKYKCATIAEAELLGICKAQDVLLAYQPIGKKTERLANLIEKYPQTKYSCLIDNEAVANDLSKIGKKKGLIFEVFIDLNTGMNRTGIVPEKAVDLSEAIQSLSNLKLLGLHCYDGNIRERDLSERKKSCDQSFLQIENLETELAEKGFSKLKIIIGGSPTYPIHAKRQKVECSPGTFVFWDKGYREICPEQDFTPAALLITRIISLPNSTKICTDLGHKSVAAENELARRVHFINAPELKFIGQSEEHLVLEAPEGHSYKVGDVLLGMPIHICPTVALHERMYVVENEQLTGSEWKVLARDRVINI
ncbi:MAG: D-TA family PLP-dependent enzyme [Bacteroidota bacterium]